MFLAAMIVSSSLLSASRAADLPPIDYRRDVLPILSENCFTCHGPDEKARKARLRLDIPFAAALAADREATKAVEPGKPDESSLLERVVQSDPELVMPPPKKGKPLSPAQVQTLRRWIQDGAKHQEHWAFAPPRRPPVPAVDPALEPRGPLDCFVLARLPEHGLSPSPLAAPAVLLRRVSLDLTGLPPTPAELDAFLSDPSPDAYQRAVDRLLASPRFGEHWAWSWLDAARYADTNGYQSDAVRTMWPWRDWVVAALNQNMPFDQFTVEQLAGDLLPAATLSQKVATGFHRNHMLNGEGGRIAEESRAEYVFDRVETTAAVWLGLTFGCCRCHNHKYDPFTQTDYYRLSAYFNSIDESGGVDRGGNASPVARLPSRAQQIEADALREKIARLEKQLAELPPLSAAQQQDWENQLRARLTASPADSWTVLVPESFNSKNGATLEKRPDHAIFVSGKNPEQDDYTLVAPLPVGRFTGLRLEALPHESFTNRGLARSDSGNFVLTELILEFDGKPLKIQSAVADFEQAGLPVKNAFDGNPITGWAVHNPADMTKPRTAVFALAAPFQAPSGAKLTIRLQHQSPHKFHNLGLFRLSLTGDPKPSLQPGSGIAPELRAAALAPSTARTADQQRLVAAELRKTREAPLRAELESAQKSLADAEKSWTEVMVLADRAQPRKTTILSRGQYDKPLSEVSWGVPASLHPLPGGAPSNRLTLARWLASPENPLTARVVVNRFWQQLFGKGLVATTEDFGIKGDPPTHPELLDWLAVDFRESGWDVKRLLRSIVLSRTYCQSSVITADALARDPANKYLARAPRYRLPTGVVRDQALAAGGLLVERLGGPGVKPYQPAGIWEEFSFGTIRYQQDHGAALYRRSLYTFWRRSVGPTMFFDVASRQTCTVKQSRTNTPLHALVTLNDVTYLEASRNLAEQILLPTPPPPAQQVRLAFVRILARPPGPAEEAALLQALERLRAQLAADSAAAKKLLQAGESPLAGKADPIDHAALALLASALMNLDETLTRQ